MLYGLRTPLLHYLFVGLLVCLLCSRRGAVAVDVPCFLAFLASLGVAWLRLASLGFAWLCLALLGFAWLRLALLGFACLRLALLGFAWLCKASPGLAWLNYSTTYLLIY